MHPKTLPKKTAKLIAILGKQPFLKPFYLSGGTALSLQLGHRESEDLVFFSRHEFESLSLQQKLNKLGSLKDVQLEKNTLNLFFLGVQIQFLHYPYPLVRPLVNWQGINLASVLDIGCTKLQTIVARGSKKDFVDLYQIFKDYPLKKLLLTMKKKYSEVDYHQAHILKSLVYFVEAEKQPMPKLHVKIKWGTVKKAMENEVKKFKI